MAHETDTVLQRSLDAIDRMRRRVYTTGWVIVVATLAMYARLAYLHRTTDNLERLLGASVAALTFLIAWAAFAIVLSITRATKRILHAIELSVQSKG
jgi:hypothetical protein